MVGKCAKESMVKAAEEVKGLSHYASEGEVEYSLITLCFLLALRYGG